MFASRSIDRNRPSGVTSRVSSTVLSTVLHRSLRTHITYRALIGANTIVLTNRIAAATGVSIRHVMHSAIGNVNCRRSSLNFSNRAYTIVGVLNGRSPRVTRNISHDSPRRRNTNSRNLVFNCTDGRARMLVPTPVRCTRHLVRHRSRLHHTNRLP